MTDGRSVLYRDDLSLVVASAGLADSMRSHKGSALAALNQSRSAHLEDSGSLGISSGFGMLILRADRHGLHLLKIAENIQDLRHSWIKLRAITSAHGAV